MNAPPPDTTTSDAAVTLGVLKVMAASMWAPLKVNTLVAALKAQPEQVRSALSALADEKWCHYDALKDAFYVSAELWMFGRIVERQFMDAVHRFDSRVLAMMMRGYPADACAVGGS